MAATPPVPAGRGGEAGFSLLELMFAGSILLGLLFLCLTLTGRAQTMYGTASVSASGLAQAEDLARILEERFRNGGLATLDRADATYGVMDFPDGASSAVGARVRLADTFTGPGGFAIFGSCVGYAVRNAEPADGKDNDRDGLVDEKDLLLQEWAAVPGPVPLRQSLLARDIDGVSLSRVGRILRLEVRTLRFDPANRQLRTFTAVRSFALRN